MPIKRTLHEVQPDPSLQESIAPNLRPLLPKKGWRPLGNQLPVRTRQDVALKEFELAGRCYVPRCKIPNCNLRTHLQYTSASQSPRRSSSPTSGIHVAHHDSESHGLKALVGHVPAEWNAASSTLPRNALHGLEGLPDDIGETAALRELFHEFFDRVLDRFHVLFRPPPHDPSRKKDRLLTAASSPAYCINAIATVSFDRLMHRIEASDNRTATILYGKTMSVLRTQVATFDNSQVEHLLMIMMTLALFDLVNHNTAFLSVHRQGMQQLVGRVGGVHNLHHSQPTVYAMDRIIALYTGQLPLYARPLDNSIQRPKRFLEQYGSYFKSDDARSCLDAEVCDFCSEVSRTMELFEGANISFDPSLADTASANGDVTYFYFSRERVANWFTQLNHKYWDRASLSRCVALTTKILDYVIFMDNYITVIPEFLASQLKETMDGMEKLFYNEWADHHDLLSWILFVLITMPDRFGHDEWMFEKLSKILNLKYEGISRPVNWTKELQNAKRFVWCSSRLDEAFSKSCEELARYIEDKRISNAGNSSRSTVIVDNIPPGR